LQTKEKEGGEDQPVGFARGGKKPVQKKGRRSSSAQKRGEKGEMTDYITSIV